MEQVAFSLCWPCGHLVSSVALWVWMWKEKNWTQLALVQQSELNQDNQTRTTRGRSKRKSTQHSYFLQSSVPLSSPAWSFRPSKGNLLGYSCLGNPGLPWRRLGSRCTATYTRHHCILGEQLRAGEDTASAALPPLWASAQLKAISFIPLSHMPAY